jgi:hypothetical protein
MHVILFSIDACLCTCNYYATCTYSLISQVFSLNGLCICASSGITLYNYNYASQPSYMHLNCSIYAYTSWREYSCYMNCRCYMYIALFPCMQATKAVWRPGNEANMHCTIIILPKKKDVFMPVKHTYVQCQQV